MRALVACCDEGEIGVLSVSSLFLTRLGVYVGVYAHTHTHTAQMGFSVVSPGVRMRHLEGPKNPDGIILGIYISVYVYKIHICIYMPGGGIISWNNYFFL